MMSKQAPGKQRALEMDRDKRSLGLVLYIIGSVLAFLLAVITIWPDLEASLFDAARSGEAQMRNVSCPWLITANEEAAVEATFKNRLERPIQFLTYARISEGRVSLMRQENILIQLEPGETKVYRWPIRAADAAFGRLVLARVHRLRGGGEGASQKACGILLLNIPFLKGNQVVVAALLVALLSLGGGAYLWLRQGAALPGAPQRRVRNAIAVGSLILLAMAFGLLGLWLPGLLTLILVLLLLVSAMDLSIGSR